MSGFTRVRFDFDLGATSVIVGKSSPGMVEYCRKELLQLLSKGLQ